MEYTEVIENDFRYYIPYKIMVKSRYSKFLIASVYFHVVLPPVSLMPQVAQVE